MRPNRLPRPVPPTPSVEIERMTAPTYHIGTMGYACKDWRNIDPVDVIYLRLLGRHGSNAKKVAEQVDSPPLTLPRVHITLFT